MDKHLSLRVEFNKEFTQLSNSEFIEGTALIAYTGDNRNNSDITKEAFEDALPSLGLIPIVGHWISEKQNFGAHDVTIEWAGNNLILKSNTVPYGVVKQIHNAEWVDIEEGGEVHHYLKADIVLWYGRYSEPVQKVIDTGANQSMEINITSYKEKENGNIEIDGFEFSALCLLGRDIDENGVKGEENVEPCFESASVTVNQFKADDEFKKQFDELVFALNMKSQSSPKEVDDIYMQKGGEKLDKKLELIQKYENLTEEDVKELKEDIDRYSLEEFDLKLKELSESKFALTHEQIREEIYKVLNARTVAVTDWWGDTYEQKEFYYRDIKDNLVIVIDNEWENYYGIPYTVSGDSVTLDFDNKKPYMYDWRPRIEGEVVNNFAKKEVEERVKLYTEKAIAKAKESLNVKETEEYKTLVSENEELKTSNNDLSTKFNDLSNMVDTLKSENTELSAYKVQVEQAKQEAYEKAQKEAKAELVENFSKVLTAEEIKIVEDKNLAVEDMEKEFKLIFANKTLEGKFTARAKKQTEIPLAVNIPTKKSETWADCPELRKIKNNN
jgi:hypothetical protein